MSEIKRNIAITGANGFIGRALSPILIMQGKTVRSIVRSVEANGDVAVGDIGPDTKWSEALGGMNCVVHLAARVHVMHDTVKYPLQAFREVNTAGTLNLARQAAENGIERFIYISSIKVNGEATNPSDSDNDPDTRHEAISSPLSNPFPGGEREKMNSKFCENDSPNPQDAYAMSKWEAEQGLMSIAKETGMGVVIIRPPLVYGPGVKANFLQIMEWLYKGIPLPLGAIHNRRSLVAVDNLVDLIVTCIDHPEAANQVFLVSDGEDLSTTELLRRTAAALGKPARLLPIPQRLLELGLKILGKKDLAQRLCGSLQVDISKAREILGWTPPVSVDEGLRKTTEAFLQDK